MSSPSPGTAVPPAAKPPATPPPAASGSVTTLGLSGITAVLAIIPIIFTLVFHLGAATLSYQRNQSFGWAFLHFFLAVFYYPYFAFTQPSPVAESTGFLPTVQSAGRRLVKALGKRK